MRKTREQNKTKQNNLLLFIRPTTCMALGLRSPYSLTFRKAALDFRSRRSKIHELPR